MEGPLSEEGLLDKEAGWWRRGDAGNTKLLSRFASVHVSRTTMSSPDLPAYSKETWIHGAACRPICDSLQSL